MMRMLTTRSVCLFCAVALGLAGCVRLEPPENPTRYYVLGRTQLGQSQQGALRGETGYAIGIRRAQLARYLDTPLIVTRLGTHEVAFAEYHQWGEDLGRGIERALATYLSAKPAVRRADLAPWPAGVAHQYIVQLSVERFEGEAVGAEMSGAPREAFGYARFLATWEILDARDGRLLTRGSIDYNQDRWIVGNHEALVTFLDLGVEQLANDLADAIAAFESP